MSKIGVILLSYYQTNLQQKTHLHCKHCIDQGGCPLKIGILINGNLIIKNQVKQVYKRGTLPLVQHCQWSYPIMTMKARCEQCKRLDYYTVNHGPTATVLPRNGDNAMAMTCHLGLILRWHPPQMTAHLTLGPLNWVTE